MPNLFKTVMLLLVAGVSLGAVSMFHPTDPGIPRERARVVGPLYAVPVERVETHVLGRGETLSQLFAQASIAGREFADMLIALREYQSPRRLSVGTEITIRRWIETDEPRAVDIRINADSTIRLSRTEMGWQGSVRLTPVELDTVYAAGVIEQGRTLYEAIVRDETSNLPPSERIQLVSALAEIYQTRLDFTREIQAGDSYRLVYERERRPDGTARRRRILIAEVENRGLSYPAVFFTDNEDVHGYFDLKGKSVESGFSRYPIRYVRITSNFNPRRYHPVLGQYRAHLGTDYGAPHGEPVLATADGVITFQGRNGGYGNMVELRHANGYTTRYAHLSRFAKGQSRGTKVLKGQVIGYVGATGLATGPHLHYELRERGRPIDARRAQLPDGAPVPEKHMDAYLSLVQERTALLERARPMYALSGAGSTSAP